MYTTQQTLYADASVLSEFADVHFDADDVAADEHCVSLSLRASERRHVTALTVNDVIAQLFSCWLQDTQEGDNDVM